MAGLKEIHRFLKLYGKSERGSNAPRQFVWILRSIVSGDIDLAKKVLGDQVESSLLTYASIYAQRMIEMIYVFLEVSVRDEYKSWNPVSDSPRIIDLGGDPGAVSALYWKDKKPNAVVTVVEANPATVSTMRETLFRKGMTGIEVINAAISAETGKAHLTLHKPGKGWHTQDFIRVSGSGSDNEYVVEVPKLLLSDLISNNEQVDLIKIDIEGAESAAILDLERSGKLNQVRQIIMEFHHDRILFPENDLLIMISTLKRNGFLITDSHITAGSGLRRKVKIAPTILEKLYHDYDKIFLTFSAIKV